MAPGLQPTGVRATSLGRSAVPGRLTCLRTVSRPADVSGPQQCHSQLPRRVRTQRCGYLRWSPASLGHGNRLSVATNAHTAIPSAQGLFDPANDKDACGVGFVAELSKRETRKCVTDALEMLRRMAHRGACGCEVNTGDGAGILLSLPDEFLRERVERECGVTLPTRGEYAVGQIFMPQEPELRKQAKEVINRVASELGHTVLAWRRLATDNSTIGPAALATEPVAEQIFVSASLAPITSSPKLEAQFFVLRKLVEFELKKVGITEDDAFICSLSSTTIVYKGQLTPEQVPLYYEDLQDEKFSAYVALVHSRFSTNTFPSWPRAQPMRLLGHNGEINTLRGNKNWMKARQGLMKCSALGLPHEVLEKLLPIVPETQSDSGSYDTVLELLMHCGRDLPEAMMLMVPEAWQHDSLMPQAKKDYYRFHSAVMEPWDGPALLSFCDGKFIGATLDRNGLRPGRFFLTTDGRVIMGSEVGVVDIPPEQIQHKGRLMPGNILLVDFDAGRVIRDEEMKARYTALQPYGQWLDEQTVTLADVRASLGDAEEPLANGHGTPELSAGFEQSRTLSVANGNGAHVAGNGASRNAHGKASAPETGLHRILKSLKAAGYTREALEMLMLPMVKTGTEALGSMGNDSALAALSTRPRLLYDYFKQLFAQVTNPALDPFREKLVTSTRSMIGPEGDITDAPNPLQAHRQGSPSLPPKALL